MLARLRSIIYLRPLFIPWSFPPLTSTLTIDIENDISTTIYIPSVLRPQAAPSLPLEYTYPLLLAPCWHRPHQPRSWAASLPRMIRRDVHTTQTSRTTSIASTSTRCTGVCLSSSSPSCLLPHGYIKRTNAYLFQTLHQSTLRFVQCPLSLPAIADRFSGQCDTETMKNSIT
jgi:hypothetical protein